MDRMNRHVSGINSLKVLVLLIFTQVICACASPPAPKLIQETLQSETMLRPWNTKSFGERKPYKVISVVAAESVQGDIVILRWNPEGTGFAAEIYRQEESLGPLPSWTYRDSGHTKTINLQPNGEFYITDLVEGSEGGQRVEIFRLGAD